VTFFAPSGFNLTAHAIKEADRLGLEFAMHQLPRLVVQWRPLDHAPSLPCSNGLERDLRNRRHPVDLPLAQPYTKLDYYRDAVVVAFPSLAGETRLCAK